MGKWTTKKASIGSAFDDFLKDEGSYEASEGVAIKRVLAWQTEGRQRRSDASRPDDR